MNGWGSDIAVVAYSPMASGLLTGKFTRERIGAPAARTSKLSRRLRNAVGKPGDGSERRYG